MSADNAPPSKAPVPDLPNLSGIGGANADVLDELAELLAKHKLVPFFGAGISRQQLGVAGAELAREMAAQLSEPEDTLLSKVADDFADRLGEDALLVFLKRKLILSQFDDAKVPIHRLLVSLSLNLLYTTNQDNVFELVASHYGRHYRPITTLEDLSEWNPGEPALIKFHGSLDNASSLVFGTRSYAIRIKAADHPLDIRLRSDLLGKRLLFLGYGLQDENVTKLLVNIQRVFGGKMPPSYLLAFDYDASMDGFSAEYNVEVIDPRKLCPGVSTNAEAFERCLKYLCDATIKNQVSHGLEALFSDQQTNARVATEYEVAAVEKAVNDGDFDSALAVFRAVFDLTGIPTSLQQRVTNIFNRLVERTDANNDKHLDALLAALFNFRPPPQFAIQALASVMTIANRRRQQSGPDHFMYLPCPGIPDGFHPVAAALAVIRLRERGEQITDNFRTTAGWWFRGYDELEPKMTAMVKATIVEAWPGSKAAESPINRPMRLPFATKGFHAIAKELQEKMPKKFKDPEQ